MGRGRRTKQRKDQRDDVTPERRSHNDIESAGMARKVVPVIDILFKRGDLCERRWRLLGYYADQAALADKSPIRSCCDTSPRGGNGPSVAIMSAQLETGRIERDLGALLDIARAIAVDNKSLSQWCIEKHGGRERYDGKGTFVAIVPISEKRSIEMARLELRMAADRITPSLDKRR